MATATHPLPQPARPVRRIMRGIGWFLLIPITAFLLLSGLLWWEVETYQADHAGKIYTGVRIWQHELGGMTVEEAQRYLATVAPPVAAYDLTLIDPNSGQQWVKTSAELGVHYDTASLVEQAYQFGRTGDQQTQRRTQFSLWYHGINLDPNIIVDEQYVDRWIATIASAVETPAIDGTFDIIDGAVVYTSGQSGTRLDQAAAHQQLISALYSFNSAEIPLTITTVAPAVGELNTAATEIQNLLASPLHLYFEKPLTSSDLAGVSLPAAELSSWMHIDWTVVDGQRQPNAKLDEAAITNWVSSFATDIYREPVRARFYFDDITRQLVLVEPHSPGRELNVAATVANIIAAATSSSRSIPFVIDEITPLVNSNATATELGITELVVEATSSFAGSSPERMANIARSAENFYGIVIAPGEDFSFNKYLGEISKEQGYETGLIIWGDKTIEGVGGGVCQVSTTLYQAAFWGGFDLGQRVPHGYRVSYYENLSAPDGLSNIGMDATIYSPIIDMTFTNNTEHHILIENYYYPGSRSLQFKIYSTDTGRQVTRNVSLSNQTEPIPDRYRYNPNWYGAGLKQVEWASGGATVDVYRVVTDATGAAIDEDNFRSSYVPWGNVFEYGPNTDPALIPGDDS